MYLASEKTQWVQILTAMPNIPESDMKVSYDQRENDFYRLFFDLNIHTVACL